MSEPADVMKARGLVRKWEARGGHDTYFTCLDGGWRGYQAACWTCDWRGPEYLRGDEPMGTPESQRHKTQARQDALAHQWDTTPADWRNP